MFEWLIEKIVLAVGFVVLFAFVVSFKTFFVVPIAVIAGCYLAARLWIKKRVYQILVVGLPVLYFVGGFIISIFIMLWMITPF